MNIPKIILMAGLAIGGICVVAAVGKPRKPITPGQAALAVLVNGFYIALVAACWPTP